MTFRSVLLASVLGLVAGAAAGALSSRNIAGAVRQDVGHAHTNAQRAPAGVDPVLRLAFPSDDGRISRVFSALHQEVRFLRRFELFEALRDLTAEDLPALVKHAESLPRKTGAELLLSLVERWFEVDSNAAKAWVHSSAKDHEVIELWARADPEDAFQTAAGSRERWTFSLLTYALTAMHGNDLAAQAVRVRSLPPGKLRDEATANIMQRWGQQDPVAAYALLDELPQGQARDDARESIMMQWADRDPEAAIAELTNLLPTMKAGILGNPLVSGVAQRIAAKNPRLALEWLSGIPGEFSSLPIIATARDWADKEPVAALEWCLASGVDLTRPQWTGPSSWQPAVLAAAMKSSPEEIFAMLGALPASADRNRLLECAFMESLWHTPKEKLFDADEEMAWGFFDQLGEEAKIAKAALFGQRRAEHGDLTDLGAWAQNFPPGLARSNALAGAIIGAYPRDAARAEALLASVASGADRDAALRGLAEVMGRGAPADAATRALGISNTVVQQDALEGVIVPWLKSDPEASRAWLQTATTVPAAWKQKWLQRP